MRPLPPAVSLGDLIDKHERKIKMAAKKKVKKAVKKAAKKVAKKVAGKVAAAY